MVTKTLTYVNKEQFPAELMDQVYGFIDSKIQYQEFIINQAVKSYVDIEPYFPDKNNLKPGHPFAKLMEHNARVLEKIDQANRRIKLLFITRKRLTHENAAIVLEKISDGTFDNYSAQALMSFFDQSRAHRESA